MVEKNARREMAFAILIVLMLILSLKGLITLFQFVGYVSYLEAEGGTITEIEITAKFDVTHWSALYGTAWGVGWTQEWEFNMTGNTTLSETTNEKHLLFECFESGIEHELYASMVPEDEVDFNSLQAATTAEYDAYMGVSSSSFYSATNTFTSTDTFEVGDRDVLAPATYTYTYDGSGSTSFISGILKDNLGHLVLVTKILMTPVNGYTGERFNYQMLLPIVNASWQDYYVWNDPTDTCPEGQGSAPWEGYVYGNVTDTSGNPLGLVIVEVQGETAYSDNITGFYNLTVEEGNWSIYAVKTGYRTYRSNVSVVRGNSTVHNIVMVTENPPNPPLTGIGPGIDNPGTKTKDQEGVDAEGTETKSSDYDMPPVMQRPKKIEGTDYIVSIADINRKIRLGNFLQEKITLYSFKEATANVYFSIEGNVSPLIKIDKESMLLAPRSSDFLTLTIFGVGDTGIYNGSLIMSGDFNVTIPITIEVLPKEKLPIEALLIDLELNNKEVYPGEALKFKIDLRNLITDLQYPASLFFSVQDIDGKETLWTYETNVFIKTSFSMIKSAIIPPDAKSGDYVLRVTANYLGLSSSTSTIFSVVTPWYLVRVIGPIQVGHILLFLILVALAGLSYWQIRKKIESKKKFHLKVEMSELPKPGPRSIWVGKIAETDTKTYFNMESFMTHCIDAGSTGSGKSVSAQVIVEEMLQKGVAVIVFDPTAQWTGMLRKCDDKVMFSLYPYFGMKPTDAKGFNGNIRQVTNPREIIDIKRYVKPGEIQIFACHKLEPKDMDIFVANSIRQIFRVGFGESRTLKVLFVYDEVHRLLPKFGGSGEGFLQIERGCREFRKWGLGMLLISQVLTDFVGTIKANINTEIQMRTRDEGDLERIRVKYGDEVLKSLVKATIGSGMIENPQYNRGKPYFAAFRPLLHSVQRLTDEEIEKYNEFNDKIDQMQYEIDQLEQLGIDIFDLKLELKLATDKVKTGSFNMVEIYLEGLAPRVKKHWEKLGKTPKKLEKKLISEEDLKADIAKAKEARQVYEAEQKKKTPSAGEEVTKKEDDLFKKDVEPDKILKLTNGMLVINMASLYDEISAMKDDDYEKHMNAEKNDFADWVRNAVGDHDLADHLLLAADKKEILSFLDLKRNKKPIPKLTDDQVKKLKEVAAVAQFSKAPGDVKKKEEDKKPEEQKKGEQKEVESKKADEKKGNDKKSDEPKKVEEQKKEVEPKKGEENKKEAGKKKDDEPKKAVEKEKPAQESAKEPEEKPSAPPDHEGILAPPDRISSDISSEDYFVKIVEPEKVLSLDNGMIVMSMENLYDEINAMSPDEFGHYVDQDKNTFALWIKDAVGDGELASKMIKVKDKEKAMKLLEARRKRQKLDAESV